MASTTEIGDEFRQRVASYLAAAGHQCTEEVRFDHIKVDILCRWTDPLRGDRRIAIEAKWRSRRLNKETGRDFVNNYWPLMDGPTKVVDEAWLVSNVPVSADLRGQIAGLGMQCFTFAELQRRILGLEAYGQALINRLESELAETSYVPLRTKEGTDLLEETLSWLASDSDRPFLVLGGYGMGKTTFAKQLALTIARAAARDPTARVPVLISLGEVHDEQDITGLIARGFADRYDVFGYSFRVFERLNEDGIFLVIFDGLDEMADAMTAPRFEKNLRRLRVLERGRAKLLFLTRQTVFHSTAEYERTVLARAVTPSGNSLLLAGRRPFVGKEIASFTDGQALQVLKERFLVLARRQPDFPERPRNWLKRRLLVLSADPLKELRGRPVHIEMLAQVATDFRVRLSRLSRHQLYDIFIQQLLERETNREGRYADFRAEVRRKFNAALASWMWNRDEGMAVKFDDIPSAVFEQSVAEVAHNYNEDELKRELIAGCLVDNEGGGAHFRHRSLQEFLVAEHFLNEIQIEPDPERRQEAFTGFIQTSNREVADFVASRLRSQAWPDDVLNRLLSCLWEHRYVAVPVHILELFRTVASSRAKLAHGDRDPWLAPAPNEGPWQFILTHFISIEETSIRLSPDQFERQFEVLRAARRRGGAVWDAAAMLWSRALCEESPALDPHLLGFLSEVYCRPAVSPAEREHREASYGLHLACMAVEVDADELRLEVNLELMSRALEQGLSIRVQEKSRDGDGRIVARVPLPVLKQFLERSGWVAADVESAMRNLAGREYRNHRRSLRGSLQFGLAGHESSREERFGA